MISFRCLSHNIINPRIFFLVILLEFLSTEISVTAHILSSRFQLDEDYDSSLEKDLPVCDTKDELIPHIQCFLYYTCENSEPKLTLCQFGFNFNTKTGKCDQENNVHDCVDGIRVLPGSKEPPFFFNPFRSTILPSSGTSTTTTISTTTPFTSTPESTTEKPFRTTTETTTTFFTKITSPGRTKTTKTTTVPPPPSTSTSTSTVSKILLENETDIKTTPVPLTTESKIVTLRKYVEKFPIFSTKMTPSPIDHSSTSRTSISELPLKRTTILEYETTPEHTTTTTTARTTASTTTTLSPSTTTTSTTTTTTRMSERGCQPIKIIIHHYPGPCKAEFTCSDGSSFIVEHCTSHLLWRPSKN